MRSDSEVLAQIASDVAEIKAAVFRKPKAQEPFRAGLPPKHLRDAWAEWESKGRGTDYVFGGDKYRCSFWPEGMAVLIADHAEDWPVHEFRPHGTTWEHVERLAKERDERVTASIRADLTSEGSEGNDELTGLRKRLNYRYSDVVITTNIVTSISHASEAFAIVSKRLKPTMALKPERLAVSLSQSARWQGPTKISRAECLDLSHLTIMRIRAGDKDVITEPVSAQSQSLGGGFAWPAVRADSEIEITLAISKSVLDRVLPPFGSTKGDLRWVAVRVGLILTGSKLP